VESTVCPDLAEAVAAAARLARPGDHVLLSPGFASLDQFLSYEDRGQQFVAIVNNLGATSVLG
jgi:UDP-N-acetylmuramoylalanine--D-glutamate ligase